MPRRSESMLRLRTRVRSHVARLARSGSNLEAPRQSERNASWVASSAPPTGPVMRRASEYAWR